MRKLLLGVGIILIYSNVYSQNGNFRSIASGSWHVAATWERDADGNGTYEDSPSDFVPTVNDGAILIQAPHIVRIFSDISIDQVEVQNGGRLAINTNNVILADGLGVDLRNFGTVSTTIASQLTISALAEFEHAKNGGSLPLATWMDNSICSITGASTAAPTNLNQPGGFYHFNWNSTQSTTVYLNGNLTWIRGNMNVSNTNGFLLGFTNNSSPTPIDIDGNLTISGNSRFMFTVSASPTVNIDGNLNYNSTSTGPSSLVTGAGTTILNLGSLNINSVGGIFDLAGGSGVGTINLSGNFNLQSGTLTETGTTVGVINFVGTGTQTFTNTATISNQIDYNINAGATVQTVGESAIIGRVLTVSGTIGVTSTNTTGAITTSTTVGSIRTTSRIYNAGSRIVYNGNAVQFIGNGHPSTNDVDVEISNSSGVTFNTTTAGNSGSSVMTIGGDLILTSGNFNIVSTSTTRSLTLNGGISSVAGNITVSGSNTNFVINGSGAFGTLPHPNGMTIKNLTVNRSNGTVGFSGSLIVTGATTVTNGTLDFGGNTVLSGNVTLSNGTVLSFEDVSLSMNGTYSSSGGTLYANGNSSLTISGGTVNTAALTFTAPGNVLGTLILNKVHSGIAITINSPLTITAALTLIDGQLENVSSSLTIGSDATVSQSSIASVSGSNLTGGPYHLIYTGGSTSSSYEIPASGNLQSLTLNNSSGATVTLSQNVQITNALTVNGANRFLNCGALSISAGSINNQGIITAPSSLSVSGLTVSGDVVNSGTFNLGNGRLSVGGNLNNSGTFAVTFGTVEFSGNSMILGTPFTFHHIVITGSLTAPSTISLTGNIVTNGPFTGNNGTVNFIGTVTQVITGGTPGDFYNINVTNTTSPVSLTINSDQNLHGILTLSANVQFDADGNADVSEFTLISNASGDAGIAALPTSANILGNVTIQRYLASKDDDERFIATAVSGASVSQLQDDFEVTGTFTGTDNGCANCEDGPSLRYYHEPNSGEFGLGYAATPATFGTNAELLIPGRGYSAYMWNGGSNIVMDLTGPINRGAFSFPYLTHTASNPAEPDADGWNLLGNPYPSAIQWNSTGWTRSSNIDPTVWVWDVLGGTWVSCDHTAPGGATLPGCRIASGQAFWVYVHPGAASMSIDETVKATTDGQYFRVKTDTRPGLYLTLTGNGVSDYASIITHEQATKSFDFGLDTYKPEFGIENLSLSVLTDRNEKMSTYAVGVKDLIEIEIPLRVATKRAGTFELTFQATENFVTGEYALYDRYLNSLSSLDKPYKFTVTNDLASQGERFLLTRNRDSSPSQGEHIINYYPNPVTSRMNFEILGERPATVYVTDGLGRKVDAIKSFRSQSGVIGEIDFSNLPPALYLLMVSYDNGEKHAYKVFKK